MSVAPMAAPRDLPRPRAVTISFWCWLAASLLVGGAATLASTRADLMRAELARLARERDPAAADATVDRVAEVSVLIVVGGGAALGVLVLLLTGALRAGRGWARLLLAVLAPVAVGYGVLAAAAVTTEMLGGLRMAVAGGWCAHAVAAAVAAVAMFQRGTGPWLRR